MICFAQWNVNRNDRIHCTLFSFLLQQWKMIQRVLAHKPGPGENDVERRPFRFIISMKYQWEVKHFYFKPLGVGDCLLLQHKPVYPNWYHAFSWDSVILSTVLQALMCSLLLGDIVKTQILVQEIWGKPQGTIFLTNTQSQVVCVDATNSH